MGWNELPLELKRRVWAYVPLDDMLATVQVAMASAELREDISRRIAALRPLWAAWVDSTAMEVRNRPRHRARDARRAVAPAEFVRLERLVVGETGLAGTLSPAVAELAATLTVLHCDSNALSALPAELALCRSLRVLDMSGNRFRAVPPVVRALTSLRLLSFSQNPHLGPEIPAGLIARLPHLTHVGFYGCQLTSLSPDLIEAIVLREGAFFANVSYNAFAPGYVDALCAKYPIFRSRVFVV